MINAVTSSSCSFDTTVSDRMVEEKSKPYLGHKTHASALPKEF